MSIVSPRGFVSTSIKPGSEEVLLPPIPLQPPRELMFSLYSNLGVEDVNLELLELANGFSKQWHGGEVLPIDGWMGTTWKERMEKDILEYKPGGDRDSIIAYWDGKPAGIQQYRIHEDRTTADAEGIYVPKEYGGNKISKILRETLFSHLRAAGVKTFTIGYRAPIKPDNSSQGLARSDIRDYPDAISNLLQQDGKIIRYKLDLTKLTLRWDANKLRIST